MSHTNIISVSEMEVGEGAHLRLLLPRDEILTIDAAAGIEEDSTTITIERENEGNEQAGSLTLAQAVAVARPLPV